MIGNAVCVISWKMNSIFFFFFFFLFEYHLYADLRIRYLKRYYWNGPNMLKLKEVMSSSNAMVIKNLGLIIEKAFKIRTDF